MQRDVRVLPRSPAWAAIRRLSPGGATGQPTPQAADEERAAERYQVGERRPRSPMSVDEAAVGEAHRDVTQQVWDGGPAVVAGDLRIGRGQARREGGRARLEERVQEQVCGEEERDGRQPRRPPGAAAVLRLE